MSLETWADRRDYRGARAAPVRCPCCGKERTADSIVRVEAATTVRTAALARFALDGPVYMCSAALATLKREKLVTKDDLPRREG